MRRARTNRDLKLVQIHSSKIIPLTNNNNIYSKIPTPFDLKYRYSLGCFETKWQTWTNFLKDIGESERPLPSKAELIQQYNEFKTKYNDGKRIIGNRFNLNNPKYPGLRWGRGYYITVFGSWTKFLEVAENMYIPSKEAMIENYYKVKEIFTEINPIYGMGPLESGMLDISQSKFKGRQYDTRFLGYIEFLRNIGEIDKNPECKIVRPSRKQLQANYEFVKRELGRRPTVYDLNTHKMLTLYGYTSYSNEFGSWPKALEYFGDGDKGNRIHTIANHKDENLRDLYYKLKEKLGRKEKECVYCAEFMKYYRREQHHIASEYGGYYKMLEAFKEPLERNCVTCSKVFYPYNLTSLCCSKSCNKKRHERIRAEAHKKEHSAPVTKKCKNCGQDFLIEYSKSWTKYCSNKCGGRRLSDGFVPGQKHKIKKICVECSSEFETSYPKRLTCSLKCHNTRAVENRKKTLIDKYGGYTWRKK